MPELVPIRYGRMSLSPFAFLRGSAGVMASDLANTPVSGINAQLCGNAHLSNFGFFATPERNLVFDVNDFDETLPGPWEWDLKRLAASIVVAGLQNSYTAQENRQAVVGCVEEYRRLMRQMASMGALEVWYQHLDIGQILELAKRKGRAELQKQVEKASSGMQRVALARFTSPPGLVVWTTTEGLLDEQGPLAPIWFQLRPQSSQAAQSGYALRQCVFEVIPGLKGV